MEGLCWSIRQAGRQENMELLRLGRNLEGKEEHIEYVSGDFKHLLSSYKGCCNTAWSVLCRHISQRQHVLDIIISHAAVVGRLGVSLEIIFSATGAPSPIRTEEFPPLLMSCYRSGIPS